MILSVSISEICGKISCMKKESLMVGVLCLVVGLVIGFVGANSLNRSAAQVSPAMPIPGSNAPASGNPALPADHPPLGTSGGSDVPQGGPRPEVMAAIDKAKSQPKDYEAQMTAADLYYQIQKFDDAAKYYEAANKLKPTEVEPMIKAGNAYFDLAETAAKKNDQQTANPNFAQAEKWYLQALQKKPDDINVRSDLGLTFFERTPRDINRAIKEYKASLAIDPSHEITLQNLSIAYTENGDKDALTQTLAKLKVVNPNNPVILKAEQK